MATTIFTITLPTYAQVDANYQQGALNIIEILKILVIAAALVGFIMEVFTRRNIFFMIATIAVAAFIYSIADPVAMKNFGSEIRTFISGQTGNISDVINSDNNTNNP